MSRFRAKFRQKRVKKAMPRARTIAVSPMRTIKGGGGMLKHILGWLIGIAGLVCFVFVMPFSIFSGSIGVMVTFGVIGIVLMAIGSYLVRHS